jgi:hypothetical protein
MLVCDGIYMVHEGVIGESGAYDQLVAKNRISASLARGRESNGEYSR